MGKLWDIHGESFFLVLRNCVALEISLNTLENVEGSHPKMCKALKCFFFVWVCCSFKSLQVFPVRYLNIRLVVAVVYLSQNTGSSKCQYTYRHRWEAGHANIPSSCCRDLSTINTESGFLRGCNAQWLGIKETLLSFIIYIKVSCILRQVKIIFLPLCAFHWTEKSYESR